MTVAVQRLRLGELLALPAGLLLGVSLFLPWYSFASGNLDAWSSFTVIDFLIAPAALGGLGLTWAAVTRTSPALPVALAVWTTLLGLVAGICIGLRLLFRPAGAFDTCVGAWLGLAGALLVLVAAGLSIHDERPARGVSVRI